MVLSVEEIRHAEFGKSLSDSDVHTLAILDPSNMRSSANGDMGLGANSDMRSSANGAPLS